MHFPFNLEYIARLKLYINSSRSKFIDLLVSHRHTSNLFRDNQSSCTPNADLTIVRVRQYGNSRQEYLQMGNGSKAANEPTNWIRRTLDVTSRDARLG